MTANELADVLEDDYWDSRANKVMLEGAKMLRQQQAEIEALKKDNKELHAISQRMAMAESDARKSLQWFKDAKEMNNEPYGWVKNGEYVLYIEKPDSVFNYIPLYTHPVKELKEILSTIKCIADDVSPHKEYENTYSDGWLDACNTVYDEVFAILRKAQE